MGMERRRRGGGRAGLLQARQTQWSEWWCPSGGWDGLNGGAQPAGRRMRIAGHHSANRFVKVLVREPCIHCQSSTFESLAVGFFSLDSRCLFAVRSAEALSAADGRPRRVYLEVWLHR